MSMKFWGLLLLGVLACSGEKIREGESVKSEEPEAGFEKVYISAVEPQVATSAVDTLFLVVRGNLPSPAYKLHTIDVEVKGKAIHLTPRAKYDKEAVVIQVLVPFEKTVAVPLQKPGTYEIALHGRDKTITERVSIRQ